MSETKTNPAYEAIKDRLEEFKKKHIPVPTPEMIKTKEQIDGIIEAGKINTAILDMVGLSIHAGMSTEAINKLVHNYTVSHDAIPAPLGFEGFPKSVCVSVNDAVCHGIPSDNEILKNGDIVNVDVTTIYKGYYADASRMYCVGTPSKTALKLIQTTQESVELACKSLKPWTSRLGDIGGIINKYCKSKGFKVVREIGGHGVGVGFHEDPYVSHVSKFGTGMVLVPGMVFTIEPMVNEGTAMVYEDSGNGWTIYTWDGKLSAQVEHTIAITEDGIEILTH